MSKCINKMETVLEHWQTDRLTGTGRFALKTECCVVSDLWMFWWHHQLWCRHAAKTSTTTRYQHYKATLPLLHCKIFLPLLYCNIFWPLLPWKIFLSLIYYTTFLHLICCRICLLLFYWNIFLPTLYCKIF